MGGHGFPCPLCGTPTRVTDTRRIPGGLRRRRVCPADGCDMKLTTAELVVNQNWSTGNGVRGPDVGTVVAVRLRDLQTIATIINNGLGMNSDTEEGEDATH